MVEFFNRTQKIPYSFDDSGNSFGLCNDGVLLGSIDTENDIIINKTFITWDMINGDQVEMKNDLKKWFDNIEDILKFVPKSKLG